MMIIENPVEERAWRGGLEMILCDASTEIIV